MNRLQVVRQTWERLGARERRMVAAAAALLLAVLVWSVGIAPALKTLGTAPAQIEKLDAQWQAMQELAAQAQTLQSRPSMPHADAVRALELSVQQRLGASAQLSVAGNRATVTLKGAAPEVLAQWLSQARLSARAVAAQARLTRGISGWDGTIVLDLPPPA